MMKTESAQYALLLGDKKTEGGVWMENGFWHAALSNYQAIFSDFSAMHFAWILDNDLQDRTKASSFDEWRQTIILHIIW